jgi:methionyl-tRNA synthetase
MGQHIDIFTTPVFTNYQLRLNERGLIYKGSYAGWYSISDECFYTEDQITKAALADNPEMIYYVATETGSRVEWIQEENYMFKLSSFRDKLLDHLQKTPDFIFPPAKHLEMIEYLKVYPLNDLSISRPRSRLAWGIPVPNDQQHTMYVWFEALMSYLSGIGYPIPRKFRAWPPDVQVIGKDILRYVSFLFQFLIFSNCR